MKIGSNLDELPMIVLEVLEVRLGLTWAQIAELTFEEAFKRYFDEAFRRYRVYEGLPGSWGATLWHVAGVMKDLERAAAMKSGG